MNLPAIEKLNILLKELAIRLLTFDYFAIKQVIKKELQLKRNEKVLDLGCGTGLLATIFSPNNYIGFDVDNKLINFAKQMYPKYKFITMDAARLFFPPKTFDKVLIVGVVHHLDSKSCRGMFLRIKNVLKKRGKVLAIEAIPPINKYNIIGKFLREHDEGHHITTMDGYTRVFAKYFSVKKSYQRHGGILDYGIFLLEN